MAHTDRDALVSLYNATGGANWKQKANWDTGADLSQWCGIKVDDQGRVVELNLFWNNLQGSIPKELGALDKLEKLSLYNKITGLIPGALGVLSKLKALFLFNNQLSGEWRRAESHPAGVGKPRRTSSTRSPEEPIHR
ncbi:unnamed protein product [Ectocarpus sp. 12 AP-2014]